jgi:hypothetical protein
MSRRKGREKEKKDREVKEELKERDYLADIDKYMYPYFESFLPHTDRIRMSLVNKRYPRRTYDYYVALANEKGFNRIEEYIIFLLGDLDPEGIGLLELYIKHNKNARPGITFLSNLYNRLGGISQEEFSFAYPVIQLCEPYINNIHFRRFYNRGDNYKTIKFLFDKIENKDRYDVDRMFIIYVHLLLGMLHYMGCNDAYCRNSKRMILYIDYNFSKYDVHTKRRIFKKFLEEFISFAKTYRKLLVFNPQLEYYEEHKMLFDFLIDKIHEFRLFPKQIYFSKSRNLISRTVQRKVSTNPRMVRSLSRSTSSERSLSPRRSKSRKGSR